MARFKGNQRSLLVNDETWILVAGINVTVFHGLTGVFRFSATRLWNCMYRQCYEKVLTKLVPLFKYNTSTFIYLNEIEQADEKKLSSQNLIFIIFDASGYCWMQFYLWTLFLGSALQRRVIRGPRDLLQESKKGTDQLTTLMLARQNTNSVFQGFFEVAAKGKPGGWPQGHSHNIVPWGHRSTSLYYDMNQRSCLTCVIPPR